MLSFITSCTACDAQIRQFQVVGRKARTEKEPNPPAYRMKLFAPNPVLAQSRFWYFLHQMKKMKKTTGEILDISEVRRVYRVTSETLSVVMAT